MAIDADDPIIDRLKEDELPVYPGKVIYTDPKSEPVINISNIVAISTLISHGWKLRPIKFLSYTVMQIIKDDAIIGSFNVEDEGDIEAWMTLLK